MREKLEILTEVNNSVHMSKFKNNLCLSFPRYSFKRSSDVDLKMREVQLAGWLGEILNDVDWTLQK